MSQKTKVLKNEYFDVCYCRFFIHSITEKNEEILFDCIETNVEKLLQLRQELLIKIMKVATKTTIAAQVIQKF